MIRILILVHLKIYFLPFLVIQIQTKKVKHHFHLAVVVAMEDLIFLAMKVFLLVATNNFIANNNNNINNNNIVINKALLNREILKDIQINSN